MHSEACLALSVRRMNAQFFRVAWGMPVIWDETFWMGTSAMPRCCMDRPHSHFAHRPTETWLLAGTRKTRCCGHETLCIAYWGVKSLQRQVKLSAPWQRDGMIIIGYQIRHKNKFFKEDVRWGSSLTSRWLGEDDCICLRGARGCTIKSMQQCDVRQYAASDGTYQESERAVTEAMGDQIAVKA